MWLISVGNLTLLSLKKKEGKQMKIWKAIPLGMYLIAWFERAGRDGKITQKEITDAMLGAMDVVGIKIDLAVPAPPVQPNHIVFTEGDPI